MSEKFAEDEQLKALVDLWLNTRASDAQRDASKGIGFLYKPTTDIRDIRVVTRIIASELTKGKSKRELIERFVKSGWSEESASEFVTSIEQASKYLRHMLYGVVSLVVGVVFTVGTYILAVASRSGFYIVAFGAIGVGIIEFFRGLFGCLKYKQCLRKMGFWCIISLSLQQQG